jgi:CheY-like chemotaxis protein
MLAGGIAHEYNNLHFAILGTLDLLLMRDDLDAAIRQHVNRVRDAAQRASEITNNLVAFARGGTGVRAVVNLSELVESTLNVVRKEFTTSGIEVELELAPEPVPVMGNRAELGQVLVNLLVNSRQALDDAPEQRLTVTTSGLNGHAAVRIADTGHGISPENLPRLFDPFFTTKGAAGSWLEDRAESDAYLPGRGLGLSVAQTIVTEHGGEIEVESAPGEGAVFTVVLPKYEAEGGVIATDPMAANVRKGRILVADDEPSVRAVCRELLTHLNYDVTEASGGQEAIELLTREKYALVLVDLQMPDMDGLDLIRRINEMPGRRRPAKLVITGLTDHIDPETCDELGIASTVMKPASLLELTEKVRLALSQRP